MTNMLNLKIVTFLWASLTFSLPCKAAEQIEGWQSEWKCGVEIKVTKDLIASIEPTYVATKNGKLPEFLIGVRRLSSDGQYFWDHPTLIFVNDGGNWRAFPIEATHGVYKVLTDSENGTVMIFTMHDMEAPGQNFTVASTVDGFKSLRCGNLPAPAIALDVDDYMEVMFYEKIAGTIGKLHGIVRRTPPEKSVWLEASTNDSGLTWTAPRPTDRHFYTDIPDYPYPLKLPDDLRKFAQ